MGCYPMFFCENWTELPGDLCGLAKSSVSLALVADPFHAPPPETLQGLFDCVRHFKDHFVVDLGQPLDRCVKASHRANVRKALRSVDVRVNPHPVERLGEWTALFDGLARRHGLSGLRAFSPAAFSRQLEVPGMVMFEAWAGGALVGLDLWYLHGDVAYGHLAAFDDEGYRLRASYATKWTVLQHFASRARWVDLGGSAGLAGREDGLTKFKAGWSTGTRPVYFCGKVLQPAKYETLVAATGSSGSRYFPAYRSGEFA